MLEDNRGNDTGGSLRETVYTGKDFYLMWPAVCVQEDPCMGVLTCQC